MPACGASLPYDAEPAPKRITRAAAAAAAAIEGSADAIRAGAAIAAERSEQRPDTCATAKAVRWKGDLGKLKQAASGRARAKAAADTAAPLVSSQLWRKGCGRHALVSCRSAAHPAAGAAGAHTGTVDGRVGAPGGGGGGSSGGSNVGVNFSRGVDIGQDCRAISAGKEEVTGMPGVENLEASISGKSSWNMLWFYYGMHHVVPKHSSFAIA